jgi:ribonuclease HIII
MGNSLVFVHPKDTALDNLKSILSQLNVKITQTDEINKGLGIKVSAIYNNSSFSMVLYFSNKTQQSSRIVFENAPHELQSQIRSKIGKEVVVPLTEKKAIPIYFSVDIKDEDSRESLKNVLYNLKVEITDCGNVDYADYRIRMQDDKAFLTVTQYISGKLLVQGVYSQLVDRIIEIIDQYKPLTDIERALLYAPKESQGSLRSDLETRKNIFQEIQSKCVIDQDELLDFLFDNDKKTYITGEGLIDILGETDKKLLEYNFVVAQFAKVFEGFIIRVMIDKSFFTLDEYGKNPNIADIGNALRKEKFCKYIKNKMRYGYVIENLISTWEGSRCKEMHSDPMAVQEIITAPTLEEAIDRVGSIKTCMNDAYRILVKYGLTDDDLESKDIIQDKDNSISNNHDLFTNVIGIDESGKGDYFGPLVIAGVMVKDSDNDKLINLGVKDSKSLSDNKIKEISDGIRRLIGEDRISIVPISPEKYNELYLKINNLNRLLAWGHARVLENLLDKEDCKVAISDQFGDQEFLNSALMKKGQSIKLIQMPRAEQHVSVATASILARNAFIERLERLCSQYKIPLSKGASDQVVENAKRIVKQHGQDALTKVAKLHFKTTQKVLISQK